MRPILSMLLLFSSALPAAYAQNSDNQVLSHYESTGTCFVYIKGGPLEKSVRPCKKWCPKTKGKPGIGCRTPVTDFSKVDQSTISKDDDGNKWYPGTCVCEDPKDFIPLIQPVIEGLSQLDHVICAVTVESFKTIAEIGVDAIPGGAEVNAAVKGAKTFVDNGLKAANFFDNWVGKVCGVPDWNFDITDAFGNLGKAPDSMGKSQGCFQKDKKHCKSSNKKKSKRRSNKSNRNSKAQ